MKLFTCPLGSISENTSFWKSDSRLKRSSIKVDGAEVASEKPGLFHYNLTSTPTIRHMIDSGGSTTFRRKLYIDRWRELLKRGYTESAQIRTLFHRAMTARPSRRPVPWELQMPSVKNMIPQPQATCGYIVSEPSNLTENEKQMLYRVPEILQKCGIPIDVLFEYPMRVHDSIHHQSQECDGICDYTKKQVLISRDTMHSMKTFASTVAHEYIHASTRADDLSLEFEHHLSSTIGKLVSQLL